MNLSCSKTGYSEVRAQTGQMCQHKHMQMLYVYVLLDEFCGIVHE